MTEPAVQIPAREIALDRNMAKWIAKNLNDEREAKGLDLDDPQQFLRTVAPFARQSPAQLFQDLWALWESGMKCDGYFVEFGAANGHELSNTYLLEKQFGWTGIVAEPNPVFHEALRSNRACAISTKCVFSRSGETIEFLTADRSEMSRIASIVSGDIHDQKGRRRGGTIQVPTISLHDLLLEAKVPKTIDFISVDTDGAEFEILSVFPFSSWDVRSLAIEHAMVQKNRDAVYELMTAQGYTRKWPQLSNFDDWYVKR